MKFLFASILLVLFSISLSAQTPSQTQTQSQPAVPETDIFLFELGKNNDQLQLKDPVNITKHAGYDNQPYFLSGSPSLLFTSIREGEQADIYEYNWETKETLRRTNTPESEFSPTPVPGGFSVVRVEKDQTQRLWKFSGNQAQPSLLLENVKPVGYHTWLDLTHVILFILGEPPTLQIADLKTGKAEIVEKNAGRSLHTIPGTNRASFVHKTSETDWRIKSIDIQTHEISELTPTMPGSEDYIWLSPGKILMAKDSKIFMWESGSDWKEIADLAGAGIHGITRLAISPKGDRLALVALEK